MSGGTAGNLRRLAAFLWSRPEIRSRARTIRREGVGFSWRPNAPKVVTVLLAVALTLVGLAVTTSPDALEFVNELLADNDITITEEQGWLALLASPVLLVAGSLFRGL
jgi:hypothetical protein